MATRVRVLTRRLSGEWRFPQSLLYNVEVVDDDGSHERALWSCSHDHHYPVEAQQCGLDYLIRASHRTHTPPHGDVS